MAVRCFSDDENTKIRLYYRAFAVRTSAPPMRNFGEKGGKQHRPSSVRPLHDFPSTREKWYSILCTIRYKREFACGSQKWLEVPVQSICSPPPPPKNNNNYRFKKNIKSIFGRNVVKSPPWWRERKSSPLKDQEAPEKSGFWAITRFQLKKKNFKQIYFKPDSL